MRTASNEPERSRALPMLLGLVVLGVLLAPVGAAHPPLALAPSGSPPPPPTLPPAPSGLCAGASVAASYLGTLLVNSGGASAPSAAGRTVNVSYDYQLNDTPSGGSSSYQCLAGEASAVTNASGGFTVVLPIPRTVCNSAGCSYYSGPYGPLGLTVGPMPSGYFLTSAVSGSSAVLTLVRALDHVQLTPSSRVTLSPGAATPVTALALAANGAPSPAQLTYAWQLLGTGWTLNGSGTPTVTIEAADSAAPGSLTVWVNGSYTGAAQSAPSVTLGLAAAATTVTGTSVLPTLLDVGTPAVFTVSGSGASGYNYSAEIVPGLGAPNVTVPCSSSVLEGGRWTLVCAATVSYPQAGTASPTATLTNGYSSAPAAFLPLPVGSALQLSVTPSPFLAYAGVPTDVAVTAGASTGTAPYGPACLWPGDGRVLCRMGAGPSFTLPVSYPYGGAYSAHVSLADAGASNATAAFSAQVFARPSLGPITASGPVAVGSTTTLSSVLSGGALPVTYWWNTTGAGGAATGTLFEGTTASDGTILLPFGPHASGPVGITLTIRDSLGSPLSQSVPLVVGPGPFAALQDRADNGTDAAVAGVPFPLQWVATDAGGEPVVGAPTFLLTVTPPGTGAPLVWFNLSGHPVASSGPGNAGGGSRQFEVPGASWHNGFLNATLAFGAAGPWTVAFPPGFPVSDASSGLRVLSVAPDLHHLVLTDPTALPNNVRSWSGDLGVTDRFGDPIDGGYLELRSDFNGVSTYAELPVTLHTGAGANVSTVRLAFSAPDPAGGTVTLCDPYGEPFAPAIVVPPATGASLLPSWWWVPFPLAAVLGGAGYAFARRRRPTGGAPPAVAPGNTEDELRRLAEGRAHVLARADGAEGRTLDELAEGYPGTPPTPEEMTDWVASLVAEGSLRTVLGPDGRSRFLLTENARPPVQVQLDEEALRSALDRRDAADPGDSEPEA